MSIVPKTIYRFNAIPIKLPAVIFYRARTNNFKMCMEIQKKPRIAKAILRKKNGTGGISLLDSGSTTKQQSSRQYGPGTKTET